METQVASWAAVAVSIVALGLSAFNTIRAHALHKTQLALARRQLDEKDEEGRRASRADVSARLVREGKRYSLKVWNGGPAEARDVVLVLPGDGDLVSVREVERFFPMAVMRHRQSVDVLVLPTFSSSSKEMITLEWTDGTGRHREDVWITV